MYFKLLEQENCVIHKADFLKFNLKDKVFEDDVPGPKKDPKTFMLAQFRKFGPSAL